MPQGLSIYKEPSIGNRDNNVLKFSIKNFKLFP